VSVVLPVYNTMRYLERCLDSVLRQDILAEELEVIAVDDGSTDGSGELLDSYATRDERVMVIHQATSGWPGQPRNRGTAVSRGRYVFFMDSDDHLGREAMRRTCDFADENCSDVVVPRIVPFRARSWIWRETLVDADLRVAFYTLSPPKLIRRSYIETQGLRFPEGRVRLEDGIYSAQAYLCASRVSILGGYDFYHKCRREDGTNISSQRSQPREHLRSVSIIMQIIREFAKDDDLADDLVQIIWEWKALRKLRPRSLLTWDHKARSEWVAAIGALGESHVPRELDRRLTAFDQLRSEFARSGDVDALVALAKVQAGPKPWQVVTKDGRVCRDPRSRSVVRRDSAGQRALEAEIDAIREALRGTEVARGRWETRLRTLISGIGRGRMRLLLAKLRSSAAHHGKRGLPDDRWHSALTGLALLAQMNPTDGTSFADLLTGVAGVLA
jgi:glycosyltransferase involved in cell wall biosynthesis